MKQSIWKFDLQVESEQIIRLPKDADILSVQIQNGAPRIWAIVNTVNPVVDRHVYMFGTGHPFDKPDANYVGTIQEAQGALIWHVFIDA